MSSSLPRAPGLPILGNLHQVTGGRIAFALERWADEVAPTFRFRIMGREGVCFSELEPILEVLKRRPDDFRRVRHFEPIARELMLYGVFAAEGEDWKRHRRLVTPAFSRASLASGFEHVRKITGRVIDRWSDRAGEPFDALDDLMCFTADVTTLLAFGYDMNSLSQNDGLQREVLRIFDTLSRRVVAPFPYWRKFRLPRDRRAERAVKTLNDLVLKIVREGGPEAIRGTALETLLEAGKDERLTDAEIAGNMMTLLLAGEDTTANTLGWCLYYLALHPEIFRKLRDEADAVLGDARAPESLEQTNALAYAACVFKEALRMRSPAPLLIFSPTQDTRVGPVELKTSQVVAMLTRKLSMDSRHFSEPERFWPERWSSPSPAALHTPRAMLAFGGGPRACLGAQLAVVEGQSFLAAVCRNFDLTLACRPEEVGESYAFVMRPSRLPVRLTPR